MIEKFRANMILMGRKLVPQMFQVKSPKMHYEIASYLHDSKIKFLNIIAPRGHAKSSLVGCLMVLWHIFVERKGQPSFVVLISKTKDHAIKLLQTLTDIMEYSQPFRDVFGYHGRFTAIKWTTSEVVLPGGITITCRGIGQQAVGLKSLHQRPTLIVGDDLEDQASCKTPELMEYNRRWFLGTVVPTRDPIVGRVIVIGTPQHENCIVEVLSGISNWVTLRYSAITNLGTDNEVALWPEWKSLESLHEELTMAEEMGRSDIFYREYQCQCIGGAAQLFKPEYIRYYDGSLTYKGEEAFLHLREKHNTRLENVTLPVTIFMGIDPASSTSNKADFSTIVPIAVSAVEDVYVLPYFRGRVHPMQLGDKVIEYYETYRPTRTAIETVAYQEMLRDYLLSKKFIPGLEQKNNPRGPKEKRLESMQPLFAQGKIYVLKSMTELVAELVSYPKSKHDDLMDGLYYATKRRFGPHHALPRPEQKYEYGDEVLRFFLDIGEKEFEDRPKMRRGENGLRMTEEEYERRYIDIENIGE